MTISPRFLSALRAPALCGVLACTSATLPPASQPVSPPPATTWIQVWNDEFEGPAGAPPDSTHWRYDTTDGCTTGNCGWGNNEKEYYTNAAENVALNGQGQLAIVARTAAGLACYYGPCRYTSGKITTHDKMLAVPGRVEARIKLPVGQGLWPAFWMLGHDCGPVPWPTCGELDIMENKGSNPAATSSAMHGPGYSGNTPFAHLQPTGQGTLISDYHTYAVEWDSVHVRFFVDSVAHYTVTSDLVTQYGQSILNQPFYVILNLAVGGNFDGDPRSDAIFPATMLVDYVRVFRAGAP